MSKDKKPRQKQAAERAAAKRVAADAQRREEHVALIMERDGDPRFAERHTRLADGSKRVPISPELAQRIKEQKQAFVAKFGREPGADDPLFFDPDADTPQPYPTERYYAEMRAALAAAGADPAFALAAEEVDYMVTEDNRHLFSAAEVDAYETAVLRHQRSSPQP